MANIFPAEDYQLCALDCIGKHKCKLITFGPNNYHIDLTHQITNHKKIFNKIDKKYEKIWYRVMNSKEISDFTRKYESSMRYEYFANDVLMNNMELMTYYSSLTDNEKSLYVQKCESIIPPVKDVEEYSEADDCVIVEDSHDCDQLLMEMYKHDEIAYRMAKSFELMYQE